MPEDHPTTDGQREAKQIRKNILPVIITNEEFVTVSEHTAAVTWVTNVQADTRIQWGASLEMGNETVKDDSARYHIMNLDELEQGTSYFNRIGSGGRWRSIKDFTTLEEPGSGMTLRFAIAADPHMNHPQIHP